MQNYNSNMDSDYTDLYSQYTKMHSNNVDLDSNNGVLHYQTNDIKSMPLQSDMQTNSIRENYDDMQVQLKSESAPPRRSTPDITRDLALCYDNDMSTSLAPDDTDSAASDIRPKRENTDMEVVSNIGIEENSVKPPSERRSSVSLKVEKVSEDVPAESAETVPKLLTEKPARGIAAETKRRGSVSSAKETARKDVCRVCMDASNGVLISVFDSGDGSARRLCEKVMTCAAVQVSPHDGLPELICERCAADLEVAYQFKLRCERSDIALRDKLGVKKKTIVKTEFVLIDCDNEPVVSDDNSKLKDSASDADSDPSYGAKRKRKKKTKKLPKIKETVGKRKSKPTVKAENLTKNESDDDVILVSKKPQQKRSSIKGDYPCTYCEKTFPYPSVLKLHVVTHTKEKTHKCSICNVSFMYSKELYAHYKDDHPSEYGKFDGKNYACTSCDKVFGQERNLKVHQAVHGREKKYKCEVCSVGFTNMTNLNMHKKQEHPGAAKPYKCKICDKRFKQQVSMERHVENHKQHSVSQTRTVIEERKPTSTKDLFKSIAPVTTTYWSDSFSD